MFKQKKNLYIYVRVRISVRTSHTSLCSTVYVQRKNCIYIWAWVWKKIEHLFSVNYYYFNEDIVCINPIDYANNHLFVFLLVTVKYTVKNRRIPFLFSYRIFLPCIYLYFTRKFNFLLRKRLVAKDSQWIHDSTATSILQRLKSSPFRLSIWPQTVW